VSRQWSELGRVTGEPGILGDHGDTVFRNGKTADIQPRVEPDRLACGNPHVFVDDAIPQTGSRVNRDICKEKTSLDLSPLFNAGIPFADNRVPMPPPS
jgi:hypothetical protein